MRDGEYRMQDQVETRKRTSVFPLTSWGQDKFHRIIADSCREC